MEAEDVNGTALSQPPVSVTPDTDNAPRRTVGRPFAPGNKYGKGRPRKGESIPERLKRAIEQPKTTEAIVQATVARLLREDAVGNRAFADVRDTVYGIPKQTLVLEHGESPADALDARLAQLLGQTVDGEARLLDDNPQADASAASD